VLVPKKDILIIIGDFRPISLLNSSVKLLTKILANRLQKIILKIIHRNQYSFLKERNTQDCLSWAFEYLYLFKKSKKEIIILKLDFEKVFDRIEHKAIMEVLHHKGFGARWQQWMNMIMNTGTSSILLNGVPGKTFHCRRGVR
jgi:retron-type reverse transcriptase